MAQASSLVQFLIVVLAAWLARQQESFVEYLKAENRVLKARLGRRRVIFTDSERSLLARHAKAVGRKRLLEFEPIVSPDRADVLSVSAGRPVQRRLRLGGMLSFYHHAAA